MWLLVNTNTEMSAAACNWTIIDRKVIQKSSRVLLERLWQMSCGILEYLSLRVARGVQVRQPSWCQNFLECPENPKSPTKYFPAGGKFTGKLQHLDRNLPAIYRTKAGGMFCMAKLLSSVRYDINHMWLRQTFKLILSSALFTMSKHTFKLRTNTTAPSLSISI